jgi:hypothetical protein
MVTPEQEATIRQVCLAFLEMFADVQAQTVNELVNLIGSDRQETIAVWQKTTRELQARVQRAARAKNN